MKRLRTPGITDKDTEKNRIFHLKKSSTPHYCKYLKLWSLRFQISSYFQVYLKKKKMHTSPLTQKHILRSVPSYFVAQTLPSYHTYVITEVKYNWVQCVSKRTTFYHSSPEHHLFSLLYFTSCSSVLGWHS